jgi:hypothetical protein
LALTFGGLESVFVMASIQEKRSCFNTSKAGGAKWEVGGMVDRQTNKPLQK